MEYDLKQDVLRELRYGNGRTLLHDEAEDRPGHFDIVPIWETVEEVDIMTPRDVFGLMIAEGYKASTFSQRIVLNLCTKLADKLWSRGCHR